MGWPVVWLCQIAAAIASARSVGAILICRETCEAIATGCPHSSFHSKPAQSAAGPRGEPLTQPADPASARRGSNSQTSATDANGPATTTQVRDTCCLFGQP